MIPWRDYQENTAKFFRDIGLEAETDVRLSGVRTTHDIDVVVRSHHIGFDMLWLVECKHWKKRVSKVHVLALREIVADLGADRGILMAESGFQDGALEAARLTNVRLTSLATLNETAGYDLGMAQLRIIAERVTQCSERYWNIDKQTRIDHGLRPDVYAVGYSGAHAIEAMEHLLNQAFRGRFPVSNYDELLSHVLTGFRIEAQTPRELVEKLEGHVSELEQRLEITEAACQKDSDNT